MTVNRRMTKRGAVYDVRLRALDGRPYKRSFRTRRAAEVFEVREIADRSRGTWIDPRLTLAVYAQATTEADTAAADALGRGSSTRAMNAP